jgi:hypothetical protein
MALFNLSSAELARLISLVKIKESLHAKLERVTEALRSLETGKPARKKRGRKPGRPAGAAKAAGKRGKVSKRKRGKRLKGPLLKALSKAGASGITVRDLAAKLKVKPGNIFSWFYTTGKKINGIKKVGEARYAYSS